MDTIIEEVPVSVEPAAPSEAPEAPEALAPKTPNTSTPKAKGRPKGAKDQTIRRRRPPPPPPSESSEEVAEEPQIATMPDMRSRKQRMFDAWFD